jgi:hypothetical protein
VKSSRQQLAGAEVQARGILPERVVLSTALDLFLNLKALAQYSGLSVRTLRCHINGEPSVALPCYRLDRLILVRRSEFDGWLAVRRCVGLLGVARLARLL